MKLFRTGRTGGRRRLLFVLTAVVSLLGSTALAIGVANASVDGYFEIRNDTSNKCVDVKDKSTAPGALTQQFDCHNVNEQLWLPVDVGNGYFMLQSRNNSQMCLDVKFGSTLPETPVDQESCSIGGPRMQWRWGGSNPPHLVLQSGLGNVCLALQGFSRRNGWPIVIRDCASTSGQEWHFS